MSEAVVEALERVKALCQLSWPDHSRLFEDEPATFRDLRTLVAEVERLDRQLDAANRLGIAAELAEQTAVAEIVALRERLAMAEELLRPFAK